MKKCFLIAFAIIAISHFVKAEKIWVLPETQTKYSSTDTTIFLEVVLDQPELGTEVHILWRDLGSIVWNDTPFFRVTNPNDTVQHVGGFFIGTYKECHKIEYCGVGYKSDNTKIQSEIEIEWNNVCPPTILNENQARNDLKVFPNPANTYIYLSGEYSLGKFSLFDLIGNFVLSLSLENEMYIGMLPPGIYLYQIEDTKKVLKQGKIIILH